MSHSVVFMIKLTPHVVNKPELQYMNQTSFCNVTSNTISSGLRENVVPTNTYLFLCQNYGGKFGTIMKDGRWGRHPWEDHTYQ